MAVAKPQNAAELFYDAGHRWWLDRWASLVGDDFLRFARRDCRVLMEFVFGNSCCLLSRFASADLALMQIRQGRRHGRLQRRFGSLFGATGSANFPSRTMISRLGVFLRPARRWLISRRTSQNVWQRMENAVHRSLFRCRSRRVVMRAERLLRQSKDQLNNNINTAAQAGGPCRSYRFVLCSNGEIRHAILR